MRLTDLYDRSFFRNCGLANTEYAASCQTVADEIAAQLGPRSVVDWGCGAGLHAAALAERGARVLGVDGVRVDDDLRAPGVEIVVADLRSPVALPPAFDSYDLALCLDVLEHIDEGDADSALDNIVRGARTVILSCAPPHQGGHHHVNEKPRRYWIDKMRTRSWFYDRRASSALERAIATRSDRPSQSWTYHNLCIYRRHPTPGRRLSKKLAKSGAQSL